MSVAVRELSHITVVETFSGEFVSPDDPTVTTNGMNTTQDLTASTTPPVTKHTAFQQALTAGAATIDLTSLPDSNGVAAAVTFLGLKVQSAKFTNPSTNANNMTVAIGASNGHPLIGSAFTFTIEPGRFVHIGSSGADAGTDVAAGDRTWDITGTGSQALDVQLVAG
jgi:hypothetical protein